MARLRFKENDYLTYSVIFGFTAALVFSVFLIEGKSFVHYGSFDGDGVGQHYVALTYEGMWLRDIVRSVVNGTPHIRLWDYTIGFGSDVISTFSYYVFGDPLNLLSALVPSRYTEYLYDALIIIRLWLAGIAFTLFCHKRGFGGDRVVVSAISYAFCGFVLYAAVRHPFFANPLIYLPLILTGVERVYRNNRSDLYLVAIFLSALSNYYFFYMLAFAVAGYAVFRFFSFPHDHVVRSLIGYGLRFIALALVGISCAGVLLLPTLFDLVANSRATVKVSYDLLYTINYYLRFIPSFFAVELTDNWKCLGYSGPVMFGVVALVADRKEKKPLFLSWLLLTVCFLVPSIGSASNGFTYVSNRWCFIYSMMMCYLLVLEWDRIISCDRNMLNSIGVCTLVVVTAFVLGSNHTGNIRAFVSFTIFLLAGMLLTITSSIGKDGSSRYTQLRTNGMVALILLGVVSNAVCFYSAYGAGYARQFLDSGTAWEVLDISDYAAMHAVDTTSEETLPARGEITRRGRTIPNTSITTTQENYGIFARISSTQYYWSIVNPSFSRYIGSELGLARSRSFRTRNLEFRSYPISMLGIRYEIVDDGCVPFGFEAVAGTDNLYENKNPLSVGVTYGSVLPSSQYDNLDIVDAQQALMQTAVIDDDVPHEEVAEVSRQDLAFTDVAVTQSITPGTGVKQVDDKHYLCDSGGQIIIDFEGVSNCETYVLFEGLSFEPKSAYELYIDEDQQLYPRAAYESMSLIDRNGLKWSDANLTDGSATQFNILLTSGELQKNLTFKTPYYSWYDGTTDFLVNFGRHKEALNQVVIEVPQRGVYTFDRLEVICQPLDDLAKQIDLLKEECLMDVWCEGNAFGGKIEVSSPKVLVLTMPYSRGWKATVDGNQVDIFKANRMGMGIMLEEGSHEVRLDYFTPGLAPGINLSRCGVLLLLLIVITESDAKQRCKKLMSRRRR